MAQPYPITTSLLVYFNTGATFDYGNFIIGDTLNGIIGTSKLASNTTGDLMVDVSSQCVKASISGGYNLLTFQFEAGQATFRVVDPNGDWNPANTASPYYGYLTPNRKIRFGATYGNNGYFLFSGYIQAYNYSYPKNQEIGYVDIVAVDAFRLLTLANITTVTGAVAGETASARVNKILDQVSFPSSMREIETASTTVQADPGTLRTALAAIQNCAFSEQGAFYVGGEGYAEFYNRKHLQTAIAQTPLTFANDGTGISYWNFKPALDDKLIINQASVQSVGGTAQTATDVNSVAKYFPHSINYNNVMVQTDADSLNIARSIVASKSTTTQRIDEVTLDLTTPNYDLGIKAALGMDYFTAVHFKNVGQDGTVIDKYLEVVGVAHDITPNSWKTSFTLTAPLVTAFIIGDSNYGIIGTSLMTY